MSTGILVHLETILAISLVNNTQSIEFTLAIESSFNNCIKIEEHLQKQVIDQDRAVKSVAETTLARYVPNTSPE